MTAQPHDHPATVGYTVLVRYPDGREMQERFAGPYAIVRAAAFLDQVRRLPQPVRAWLVRNGPAGSGHCLQSVM